MNNRKLKRILEVSDDYKQITLPDSRYYQRNGKYYPSVTHVLSHYPKGKYFEDWLKKVGYSSEYIVKKASEDGTKVHNMIELYLNGEEFHFLNEKGIPQYDIEIWKMFLRFVEFWEEYEPTLLETEVHLFSDKLEVAGTCDMVCEINNQLWIVDFKTSNHIHSTYDLQAAVYGQCFEECYGIKPDRFGILWLKSSKRGPWGTKIQGKGWEMHESKRSQEENLEIFEALHKIFKVEHPNAVPAFEEYPTHIKRKV